MNDVTIQVNPIAAAVISVWQTGIAISVPQVAGPSISVAQQSIGVKVEQIAGPSVLVSSAGERGLPGAPGTAGPTGGVYEHTQGVANSTWSINHNLGYHPNVSVVDSAGRLVFADIEYINQNTLNVIAAGAFSGKAFLS